MPSNCVALFTRQQTPSHAATRPPRFRILIHHSLCCVRSRGRFARSNPSLALTRILSYINHTHGPALGALAGLPAKKGFQVVIYHTSAEPLNLITIVEGIC